MLHKKLIKLVSLVGKAFNESPVNIANAQETSQLGLRGTLLRFSSNWLFGRSSAKRQGLMMCPRYSVSYEKNLHFSPWWATPTCFRLVAFPATCLECDTTSFGNMISSCTWTRHVRHLHLLEKRTNARWKDSTVLVSLNDILLHCFESALQAKAVFSLSSSLTLIWQYPPYASSAVYTLTSLSVPMSRPCKAVDKKPLLSSSWASCNQYKSYLPVFYENEWN